MHTKNKRCEKLKYIYTSSKERKNHTCNTARDINDMGKKNNANNMQNVNIYANAKQHRNE